MMPDIVGLATVTTQGKHKIHLCLAFQFIFTLKKKQIWKDIDLTALFFFYLFTFIFNML